MALLRSHTLRAVAMAATLVLAASVAARPGAAATSSTVVGATVPSATTISTAGCLPLVPGSTDLGMVLPGSSVASSTDCTVQFGSSNDTSSLRLAQTDGSGVAMHQIPDGDLATFGTGGWQLIPGMSEVWDVEVQSDGRILALSNAGRIERFDADGTPDGGYGGTGSYSSGYAVTRGMAIGPDDRVVVAAYAGPDFRVRGVTTAGLNDPGFNGGANVSRDIQGCGDVATDVAYQPSSDAFIVVGESADCGGDTDVALIRVSRSGVVDNSFGSGGVARVDRVNVGGFYPTVDIGSDGSIYVMTRDGGSLVAAKFDPDGLLDPSFGGGVVTHVLPTVGSPGIRSTKVLPDGRVVGAGDNGGSSMELVVRLTATGGLDPSFGSGAGYVVQDNHAPGPDVLREIEVLPDGRMFGFGRVDMTGAEGLDVLVSRFEADGDADLAFDQDSWRNYTSSSAVTDEIREAGTVVPLADGRILVGGSSAGDGALFILDAAAVSDFASGSTDFAQPGVDAFGACLATATNATGTWAPVGVGNCTTANNGNWHAIPPTTSSPGATVAQAASTVTNGTLGLRFAFRAAPTQRPGSYVAPITFEVVAPAA